MRVPFLLSYAYVRERSYDEVFGGLDEPPLLFLDSGAFSAETLGVPVDIDGYGRWLQRWEPHGIAHANLDVIHDPVTSALNQRRLEEDYGLTPLPVFHAGSEWRHLEALRDQGYTYIALGGMVAHSRYVDRLRGWIMRCQRIAGPDVRLHLFGVSNDELLRRVPFYSADSSTWSMTTRYGVLWIFDQRYHHGPTSMHVSQAHAIGRMLRDAGIDPDHIADGHGGVGSNFRNAANRVGLLSVLRWQAYLAERHGVVPAPTKPATGVDGPLIFMVLSLPDQLDFYGQPVNVNIAPEVLAP